MDFAHLATRERTVSFGASQDTKELVRQAIDIVDLVGKYCQLRRQGRGYVALCPWHDDTRPSLQVNPERQSWKCWVCDVGGDVFSFVMKIEGVSFPEALAMLADQAGIALRPARWQGVLQDKRALYQAMAWAESQYHQCLLREPEADPARRYLAERGITPESIEKFRLGFSPNRWDWIVRRAQSGGPSARVLETIGLLAQNMEGNAYDRFRGRVLFPIRDVQGRPVGLGGRVLPESGNTSPAKYVNSPETPLFTKNRLLYGLDRARDAIRKSRTAMVMEGYTDVIVAHQFGFDNAVAVLGTALGAEHIRLLKRFTDRILLVLDGDEAGRRRAKEILELFVAQNVDLRVVVLPDDLDPCEFLIEHGAEAFGEVLAGRAADALDHAIRMWTDGVDLAADIHRSSEVLDRLVAIVAKAPRLRDDTKTEFRFREERVLQRLATSFRVPEEDVRNRLTALRRTERERPGLRRPVVVPGDGLRPAGAPPNAARLQPRGKLDPWQRELMELLVRHPECLPAIRAAIRPEALEHEDCREIYLASCRLADAGVLPAFERLLLEFDDPAVKNLLVELDEGGAAKKVTDPEPLLEELIRSYRTRELNRQHPVTTGVLREGRLDERQETDLLLQLLEQERARRGISLPTEGRDHASD
jgi:DNA primase